MTAMSNSAATSLFTKKRTYTKNLSIPIFDGEDVIFLGNLFDEEDVIFVGAVPETPVGGWIILKNIGDADFSECGVILLDSNMR